MKEKLEAINNELLKSFPNAKIEYRYFDDMHKFRLDFEHHTQWLYLGRETVEDNTIIELLNLLDIYQVIKAFKNNPRSKKILLTRQVASELPLES